MKLGGQMYCTKISTEFDFRGHSPRWVHNPQKCGVLVSHDTTQKQTKQCGPTKHRIGCNERIGPVCGYNVGKISVGWLAWHYFHNAACPQSQWYIWICQLWISLTACAHFPNIVAQCHIFGGAHDPHIRTRSRFLYNAPAPKFHHLCVLFRKLPCWQTNTQTDAAENIQCSSLGYDVGQILLVGFFRDTVHVYHIIILSAYLVVPGK